MLFVERNCRTQEYLHHCAACGTFEAFDFRYNENGLIQKTVPIPISQIALTARIFNPEGKINPVVWDAPLPADADTDFIYHYLNRQHVELRQRYPHFAGPDFDALEKQYGDRPFCCVEKRLTQPSRRDGQPYIRLSYIGNSFDIESENGQPVFLFRRARYKYRHSKGQGVICIEYTNGKPIYWRTFSPGTTVNRAERLWAAHTNEHTNYEQSYMTLMVDGKLRVLKGSMSAM